MRLKATIGVSALRPALALLMLIAAGEITDSQAQQYSAGADFLTLVPRGEFKQNIDNNGYGVGGHFAVALGRSPIFVGIDAGIINYGSQTRRERLSGSIPEIELEVDTDNNIVLTHFLLRVQPRTGAVRPYLDGLVGIKYLYTNTEIRSDFNDEPLASTTNLSDTTFSYGFGGGVQVRLAEFTKGRALMLDGRVRYLRGSEAEYLREGSIRRTNGSVSFEVLSSRTDVVTAQVGVSFVF
jgi:hypothetical protein